MSQYTITRDALLANPSVSHWLKQAIQHLDSRDPVDAFDDVKQLLVITTTRLNEALTPKDNSKLFWQPLPAWIPPEDQSGLPPKFGHLVNRLFKPNVNIKE